MNPRMCSSDDRSTSAAHALIKADSAIAQMFAQRRTPLLRRHMMAAPLRIPESVSVLNCDGTGSSLLAHLPLSATLHFWDGSVVVAVCKGNMVPSPGSHCSVMLMLGGIERCTCT